jgi:hypothetical protein
VRIARCGDTGEVIGPGDVAVQPAAKAAASELFELKLVLARDVRAVEAKTLLRFTWVSVHVKFAEPESSAGFPGLVAFPSS